MKRTAYVVLVGLALVMLLVAIASASTPTRYRPVSDGFAPLPGSANPRLTSPKLAASPTLPLELPAQSLNAASQRPVEPRSATPTPKPSVRPTGEIGTAVGALKGQATWFASLGSWDYGAAGPRLRAAMGDYLGRFVRVCGSSKTFRACVVVKLVTSCACQPDTRLIDLSRSAFARLGDPSVGVLEVTVSW